MKTKRITSIILILALTAALLLSCAKKEDPIPTVRTLDESEEYTFGAFTYMKNTDGTAVITSYGGNDTALVIPTSLDGCSIVGIDAGAFAENEMLTWVTLPTALETIGEYAFAYCTALSRVDMGAKLWSVGAAAFVDTPWLDSLTDEFAVVGNGVLLKYSGRGGCVDIPSGVKYIGDAFTMNGNIIGVSMPDTLRYIGDSAFAYCTELRSVEFNDGLISIGNSAFEGCENLPALLLGDSLTTIGEYAFRDCYALSYVKLGRSVEVINSGAFLSAQRLKLIYLPRSLQKIDSKAFGDCFSLALVLYESSEEAFGEIDCASSNYLLTEAERRCDYSGGIE